MKKRILKFFAVVLCLLMCAQCLMAAGLFSLNVSAASFSIPTTSEMIAKGAYVDVLRSTELFHGNNITCYSSVSSSDMTKYVALLKTKGYTQTLSKTLGNTTMYHFSHTAGSAYLVFQGSTMYLVTDNHSVTGKYVTPSYTKITDTTLGIFSLDPSHRALTDCNGMGQIFTLEDGSYLILDGGYEEDSERLFNYLYDNNKRADGKIVIHAWYFTHGHGDHIGAFKQFTADHCNDVTLQYVIANAASADDPLNNTLRSFMARYNGSPVLVRPHTGETYKFPGLTMDILYTSEDLYVHNGTISASNTSSTVSRVTVGGQTILYTGDADDVACQKMNAMYGTNLKSTFLQINHHGYGGGRGDFYDNVAPTYIFWTSSQIGTELRTSNKAYQWISSGYVDDNYTAFKYAGYDYTRVFAHDGPVELMTFPYDGNRAALPLYHAYDQKVHKGDTSLVWSEDFSGLAAGSYTAAQLGFETGWTLSGTKGATFEVTSDGKLHVSTPFQDPDVAFNVITGVGTPKLNSGDIAINMTNLPHFRDGRTVIEYEMTYHESIVPAAFGAAFRVTNEKASGSYWYEGTFLANGQFHNRYRYNTNWNYLSDDTAAKNIPYNKLTTDYITNSNFQYNGYLVTDRYSNFTDTDGDGVWTSNITKQNNTIFGSTDKYKIVVDPHNGIDVYVNDVLVSSTRVIDAWDETIFDNLIGSKFGMRIMPGMNVTFDNIKVYREDKIPELLITEIAPNGVTNNKQRFIEVYNNSDGPLNIYDYSIVCDANIREDHTFSAENVFKILPGETVWKASKNENNTVTHTNPPREEGVLEAGECALLWVANGTMKDQTATSAGNGYTLDNFRSDLGLTSDQKAFVCYNEYNPSVVMSGALMYAVGYANVDYTSGYANNTHLYGNFVSYVYHNTVTSTTNPVNDYVASGSESFTQTYPLVKLSALTNKSSLRYCYDNNNYNRNGKLMITEKDVTTHGVVEEGQIRLPELTVTINGIEREILGTKLDVTQFMTDPNAGVTVKVTDKNGKTMEYYQTTVTVADGMIIDIFEGDSGIQMLYSESFDGYTAASYQFLDSDQTTYDNVAVLEKLLGWKQITTTDGSEWEITSDGKLRIYNPYYAVYQPSTTTTYNTQNYDIQIEIGDFLSMLDKKVVLEYDFRYNNRGCEGISNAAFVLGQYVHRDGYGFAPTVTAQGFYQPKIGTKTNATNIHKQIRPEWIPYSAKGTGFTFTYGTVSNHYQIFNGTNHVKIEMDPYNGLFFSVNGVMISMVQDTAAWETLYKTYMGKLLGLSVSNGTEVVLDNIQLYAVEELAPELLITEVGNAMGDYEYIEVYNNSDRDLNIYDYKLLRNTDLATAGASGYTGVGNSWADPFRWTNANTATILKGTHTYTANVSGQKVTLTNPEDGTIKSGETAILWIPSNTTYADSTSTPKEETLEMFMNNYGLTDASKIFAAYNSDNLSLWDSGNLAYGIGYASVDYTTHNAYAMNELISYVYVNTAASTIYNVNVGTTKPAAAGASIEYDYAHNNSVKRGTLLKSVAGQKTPGTLLDDQARIVTIVIGGKEYEIPLGGSLNLNDQLSSFRLTTLAGASIRTSTPTGMRWMTAVNAEDYAALQEQITSGLITNIEIGTIIIRTEDLGDQELTLDLVNNVNCFAVKAYDTNWYDADPTVEEGYDASLVGTYLFTGSVASIKKEHYNTKYSAVGYLSVTLADGTVQTIYGGYSEEAHSRTVAEVAYNALLDPDNGLSTEELEVIAGFAACYEG